MTDELHAISLEEWKARALAAERASAAKEKMLHAITKAAESDDRIIVVVQITVGGTDVAMPLHSGQPWEADLAERWGKALGHWIHALDATVKASARLEKMMHFHMKDDR